MNEVLINQGEVGAENQGKPNHFEALSDENLLNIMTQEIDPTASTSAAEEFRRRWQEKALDPTKIRDLVEANDGGFDFQHALIILYQIQQGMLTYGQAKENLKREAEVNKNIGHSRRRRSKDR